MCELNNNFIRADDVAPRRRYHDHCVTMFVLCGCVCGYVSTIRKTHDWNDLKLGTLVLLDTMSKLIDFGFKRSRVRYRVKVGVTT